MRTHTRSMHTHTIGLHMQTLCMRTRTQAQNPNSMFSAFVSLFYLSKMSMF